MYCEIKIAASIYTCDMKYFFLAALLYCNSIFAQQLNFTEARFITGDDMNWATAGFDDAGWKTIRLNENWENQGYDGYNGYAWYRIHFRLPSSLKKNAVLQDALDFFLAKIDDADITYLNGTEIGRHGVMPEKGAAYETKWNLDRHYTVKANSSLLHWDGDNVIAVRVYDDNGGGGMFGGLPSVHFLQPLDYIQMDVLTNSFLINGKSASKEIVLKNSYTKNISGVLLAVTELNGKAFNKQSIPVIIPAGSKQTVKLSLPAAEAAIVKFVFTEKQSGDKRQAWQEMPYILTPPEKPVPHINNAAAVGCRAGAPLLLKIAATGKAPLQYAASPLPAGLFLDAATGIISGTAPAIGSYRLTVTVSNSIGTDSKTINLITGNEQLQLTPPMGWNSWNCWGLSVSDAKVRSSANAMLHSGLASHGFIYMNIDDGWEAPQRAADGSIVSNEKFPGMKNLGDYLHANGLKFGIYSSPGPTTCGGYLGSYQHVQQDADSYAAWGIDYLKYDWCSYGNLVEQHPTPEQLQQPYIEMHQAILNTGRNIVFSLCQYGMGNVWEWGHKVGGNLWRTTGDIEDTWESLKNIAFRQDIPASYNNGMYGFGDPDMLTVGMVGWGDQLHQTRLTPSEQYTEISLWSLLSAPLMLGCDLSKIDPFTYNLLSNDEVLAIDQDILAKGPVKKVINNNLQAWIKELADGSRAVGFFNLGNTMLQKKLLLKEAGLDGNYTIRDLWRQKDLMPGNSISLNIPPHGVLLLKLK